MTVIDTLFKVHLKLDYTTAMHELRVSNLSARIASELLCEDDYIEKVYYAGKLHDVGKMFVPYSILKKDQTLNKYEMLLMKYHSYLGWDFLNDLNLPEDILEMVLHHHERLNGSGYPDGLCSNDISAGSKIIAVVDVFDSMVHTRPYKPAFDFDYVLDYLVSDSSFDQGVVSCLVDIIADLGSDDRDFLYSPFDLENIV